MAQTPGALEGLKIVACSQAQAGTVGYMMAAMYGAEVIKIEPPGTGDSSRAQAGLIPGHPSSYFETNNRGKKSFTLNITMPEAKEIGYKLVKQADVFAQNFRPGALEKYGFGYEDLKKINPKIVYISVSGYGPKGPNADLPGTDSIGQALGGVAESFATPGEMMKIGVVSIADEMCAVLTYCAMMTGVYYAQKTGIGQKIDCSLLGGQIRLMGHVFNTAMWTNKPPITGQARIAGTYEKPSFASSFNDINGKPFCVQGLGTGRKGGWKEQMERLGFWKTLEERGLTNLGDAVVDKDIRAKLLKTLSELFATNTREHWVDFFRKEDIVSAPINTLLEASNDPDVLANGYVTYVDYPKYGKKLKVHGAPWSMSETPAKIGIAPELGADTEPILKKLGYSEAQIKQLKDKKVI